MTGKTLKTYPIYYLELPVRLSNLLVNNDIITILDLTKKSRQELLSIKGLAHKSIREIIHALDTHKMRLKK